MLIWAFLAVAFVLVAFGGLMAALDAAISALSRADIADLADGARFARSLRAIASDPGAHTGAVSFMRVTAETTAAVLVTLAFESIFDAWWLSLLLAAAIMTGVSFVLVGTSPRSVGRSRAKSLLRLAAPLVRFVRVLLGPLVRALIALGDRVTPTRTRSFASEEQLLSMVDEATESDVLEEDDRELIHSIFEFNETLVREIMVPRIDMVTVDADASVADAMGVFLSKGVSRIPMVREDADDVNGILYLRDVARWRFEHGDAADATPVAPLAHDAVFVPESKRADATLRQMQQQSNHLAMVVDEYGGIAGLVTMEDLIEELVGDISDEYDREVALVEDLGETGYRVSARLGVGELGELFEMELEDDDVDSVGGLLAKAVGRLPVRGSNAVVHGLALTAERTGRRGRLATVLVRRADENTEGVHGDE